MSQILQPSVLRQRRSQAAWEIQTKTLPYLLELLLHDASEWSDPSVGWVMRGKRNLLIWLLGKAINLTDGRHVMLDWSRKNSTVKAFV